MPLTIRASDLTGQLKIDKFARFATGVYNQDFFMSCIFCKIASGEVPSCRVYENEKVVAFLDNRPVNYGHTLIIPKEHHENMIDTPADLLCEIITVASELAPAILKTTALHDYNFVVNSGASAGQIVFHTHFHIIPRFAGDGYGRFRLEYKEGEADALAKKIRKKLARQTSIDK